MPLPEDSAILLSYVNTKLRDMYSSLEEFCAAEGVNMETVSKKLYEIEYKYDEETNQFV